MNSSLMSWKLIGLNVSELLDHRCFFCYFSLVLDVAFIQASPYICRFAYYSHLIDVLKCYLLVSYQMTSASF